MILKLKRTPGIYLVGFMACGKTTIGRMLAETLGWSFVDIDDDIEARAKTTISDIFDAVGEEEFRRLETGALTERVRMIERGDPMVIALGGGAFARSENYELISTNGVSIWLKCPLSMLQQRVASATHRPLARDPARFAELYRARLPLYGRADFHVEIRSDDPKPALTDILKLPIF
ncbi:MAG: shikimate kinase [Bryobacteraceae bacterium]|nr:shikimate kinase [Bryobacteraceae bacterium]